ncbi:MAG: nuclear transport factor 2 family protein [Devosia sp.]|uniref:YybH family protein n=1 Tax=Devosia sp. TaxID=1871048 RepID=UPI0033948259
MSVAATPEAVMAAYVDRINRHDFDLLISLIDPEASFWFSSGTYQGHAAVREAFERTWQRLANETYWLEDLIWIAKGVEAASCTYRFHWRATIDGETAEGKGRGTTVLAKGESGWHIVHENLSTFPE